MSERVAIVVDGVREVHAAGNSNGAYATLCGLDGDDSGVGQSSGGEVTRGEKINCPQCFAIWVTAHEYQARDFRSSARTVKGPPIERYGGALG